VGGFLASLPAVSAGYIPAAGVAAAHSGRPPGPAAHRPANRPAPRHPGQRGRDHYQFRAVTRAAEEAHIRTLLVRELTGDDFILHSVQSHNLDGPGRLVEVTAEVQRHGRDDLTLENAVSRLSL
jgi:hypothetical protein